MVQCKGCATAFGKRKKAASMLLSAFLPISYGKRELRSLLSRAKRLRNHLPDLSPQVRTPLRTPQMQGSPSRAPDCMECNDGVVAMENVGEGFTPSQLYGVERRCHCSKRTCSVVPENPIRATGLYGLPRTTETNVGRGDPTLRTAANAGNQRQSASKDYALSRTQVRA